MCVILGVWRPRTGAMLRPKPSAARALPDAARTPSSDPHHQRSPQTAARRESREARGDTPAQQSTQSHRPRAWPPTQAHPRPKQTPQHRAREAPDAQPQRHSRLPCGLPLTPSTPRTDRSLRNAERGCDLTIRLPENKPARNRLAPDLIAVLPHHCRDTFRALAFSAPARALHDTCAAPR